MDKDLELLLCLVVALGDGGGGGGALLDNFSPALVVVLP